ncbi:DUF995 domain-containing protein [Kaistia adipata]|uniref:DUF995 domain-containing protein n=1 Tax=Kaistia adipata TaxID=166954 RepID=UPI000688BE33|nr:DUF995 domain-containing protein [Kaistia adipata]
MREWNSEAGRAVARLRAAALAVVAAVAVAGPVAAATASVVEGEPPAGSAVMSAAELYALYQDKSWQWQSGAGRMDSTDRRFTAWVDGEKGKSWAEGRWLVTDGGRMCIKADWHSGQEVFPARTCFVHRIDGGTIYQKKEPDGQWYVFRHAQIRDDDEANKLVSADLVSGRLDEWMPARLKARPAVKQQAKK